MDMMALCCRKKEGVGKGVICIKAPHTVHQKPLAHHISFLFLAFLADPT